MVGLGGDPPAFSPENLQI